MVHSSIPPKKRKCFVDNDVISILSSPESTATLNSASTFRLTPHPNAEGFSQATNIASQASFGEGLTTQQPALTPMTMTPTFSPKQARKNVDDNRPTEQEIQVSTASLTLTKKAPASSKNKRKRKEKEMAGEENRDPRETADISQPRKKAKPDSKPQLISVSTSKISYNAAPSVLVDQSNADNPNARKPKKAANKPKAKKARKASTKDTKRNGNEMSAPTSTQRKETKQASKQNPTKLQSGASAKTNVKPKRVTDIEPSTALPPSSETKALAPNAPGSKCAKTEKPAKTGTKAIKKRKLTFQDKVFHHMLNAFKPFSLKTLAAELQTTSEALNHVMLSLVDKTLVTQKDFSSKKAMGRVKTLYWANHGVKAKEVHVLDTASADEIASTRQQASSVQAQLASLQRTLRGTESTLSNEDLRIKLHQEEAEVAKLRDQVAATKKRIKEANQPAKIAPKPIIRRGPPKSAALLARERCPRRLKMRINSMRAQWKSRKEKCVDFLDQLADGLEKKPKEVVKLLDIETDEAAGVSLPPKKLIEESKN